MELTGAKLADAIVELIERKYPRLKLTEEDIAEMMFGYGGEYYRSRVNEACRWLTEGKRLSRGGKGVAYDPFWYRPWFDPKRRMRRS
ncbi:MAG: hypothetical protein ACT4O2_16535 [Beijerinckiaceae bacterium]